MTEGLCTVPDAKTHQKARSDELTDIINEAILKLIKQPALRRGSYVIEDSELQAYISQKAS